VGYFAQNAAFSKALAAGETTFGTATSVEAMEAVVRNTMVQGILSIIFVTLAVVVIFTALQATWTAWKTHSSMTNEDLAVPSRIFAPSGLVATPAEKRTQAEWDARPSTGKRKARGH
jgi:carbon starvation protein